MLCTQLLSARDTLGMKDKEPPPRRGMLRMRVRGCRWGVGQEGTFISFIHCLGDTWSSCATLSLMRGQWFQFGHLAGNEEIFSVSESWVVFHFVCLVIANCRDAHMQGVTSPKLEHCCFGSEGGRQELGVKQEWDRGRCSNLVSGTYSANILEQYSQANRK